MTENAGRDADSPWQMPLSAWIAVAKRTWAETTSDNIGLIAAGVAFYGFLALVPLMGATVLTYGLVADPHTVMEHVGKLSAVMPGEAAKLIGEQLLNVVTASDGKKGLGLVAALAVALFGARNGAGAVVTALNIAYEEEETRGFVRVNVLSLAITASAVLVAIVAVVAITALGYLQSLLPAAPDWLLTVGKVAVYAVLALAGAAGAATLYRFGPARVHARWVWLTPGSLLAAVLWLALTIGFGVYVANFGNYDATYGSLGAVVVLITWLYLSSYILLFGAELNAELEHQTARDSTIRDQPIGKRGAWVADHVAEVDVPESEPSGAAEVASGQGRRDYVASRVTARVGRAAGLRKVGVLGSVAATLGLSLLRRRGRAPVGAAILGAAGLLAWLGRERRAVEGVLFDVDGTLVDSNGFHVAVWQQVFREHGKEIAPAVILAQIGKGADQLVPALLPDANAREIKALGARHGEVFKRDYLSRVRAFPGAAALLRRVHASGRSVALASSAAKDELDHYIDLLGVRDVIDATVTSDDVSASKPEGDIFATAMRKLALAPEALRVVGDTRYDVEAAKRCGIASMALRSGGIDESALRKAGAVAVYDDAAALLARFDRSPLDQ